MKKKIFFSFFKFLQRNLGLVQLNVVYFSIFLFLSSISPIFLFEVNWDFLDRRGEDCVRMIRIILNSISMNEDNSNLRFWKFCLIE